MLKDKDNIMYKLEADLTKEVKKYLDSLKPNGSFRKMSDRYHFGISDFIGCYKGVFVAIELKAEDGKPTQHQIDYIDGIIAAGGKGIVARTLGEVKAVMLSIDKEVIK